MSRCAPALVLALLSASCGAADGGLPLPPVAASVPAHLHELPVAAVATTTAAEPPSPHAPSATPTPSAPPVQDDPLPPTTRAFVAVHLPPIAEIVSVHGSGPRDVWLLSSEQELLHHDGQRVIGVHKGPCQPKEPNALGVGFDTVLTLNGEVHLYGWAPGMTESRNAEATLRGGRFVCDADWYFPARRIAASGALVWRLFCGANTWSCTIVATHGPPVPLPPQQSEYGGPPISGMWIRSADDAWMATSAEQGNVPSLLHFNGVAWERIALPDGEEVRDLWLDEEGLPWIAAAGGILRWDGHRASRIAAPPGFDAALVRGTSARDVWFFGGRFVWQWDGQRLRRAPVPLAAKSAWSTLGGEIWIAGSSSSGGMAARLPRAEAR